MIQNYQALIYETVRRIPRGKVATYGQIAALIGLPRHARLVGFALRQLTLTQEKDIPWHRVINAKGKLSLQGQSEAQQRERLKVEGVVFSRQDKIDILMYQWDE